MPPLHGLILLRRVHATVGSEAKVSVAEAAGADYVLLHTAPDWPETVKRLSNGLGVHFAYDGIGGEMLARTFASIRPFGLVASLGQAAGSIPPVNVSGLGSIRSISLSRPSVFAYVDDARLYRSAVAELFAALASGLVSTVGAEYALRDAARAHIDLEGGLTTGSVILLPLVPSRSTYTTPFEEVICEAPRVQRKERA
jgi:NADPH2:quinone reductase